MFSGYLQSLILKVLKCSLWKFTLSKDGMIFEVEGNDEIKIEGRLHNNILSLISTILLQNIILLTIMLLQYLLKRYRQSYQEE